VQFLEQAGPRPPLDKPELVSFWAGALAISFLPDLDYGDRSVGLKQGGGGGEAGGRAGGPAGGPLCMGEVRWKGDDQGGLEREKVMSPRSAGGAIEYVCATGSSISYRVRLGLCRSCSAVQSSPHSSLPWVDDPTDAHMPCIISKAGWQVQDVSGRHELHDSSSWCRSVGVSFAY
jgi:hypothetical protein